jgi:hypothetical protein
MTSYHHAEGVDYVKYDDCGTTTASFKAMRDALNATGRYGVRFSNSGSGKLHSRMPLVHTHARCNTPARLKLEHACAQYHSSRVATFLPVHTVHCVQTTKADVLLHSLAVDAQP